MLNKTELSFSNITCAKLYRKGYKRYAHVTRIPYSGPAFTFTLCDDSFQALIETLERVYPDWTDVDQQAARCV